ncbi:hypothetical protein EV2_013210 [Malus domestica]
MKYKCLIKIKDSVVKEYAEIVLQRSLPPDTPEVSPYRRWELAPSMKKQRDSRSPCAPVVKRPKAKDAVRDCRITRVDEMMDE